MKMQQAKNPMHEWFFYLFDSRKDENGYVTCFECGKRMHESFYKYLLTCYSHILDKGINRYKKYKGEEWNVKIVHPDCHNLYTMKPKEAKNQYKLRLKLIEYVKNLENEV